MTSSATLYTINQTDSFLKVLVSQIMKGHLPYKSGSPPSPIDLARIILYLPTPQAVRKARSLFLEYAVKSGCDATLLPKLRYLSLAEQPDDVSILSDISDAEHMKDDSQILRPSVVPAMSLFEQRLLLSKEVMRIVKAMSVDFKNATEDLPEDSHITPSLIFSDQLHDALSLVENFRFFLNQIVFDDIDTQQLNDVIQQVFSHYAKDDVRILTLVILQKLREVWQELCQSRNKQSHISYIMETMRYHEQKIIQDEKDNIIIAAGSTASIPQTASLLRTIAFLNQGAVILPGFDTQMQQGIDTELPETHAQYYMKKFVRYCGCDVQDVLLLTDESLVSDINVTDKWKKNRQDLIRTVLLPGSDTVQWSDKMEQLTNTCKTKDVLPTGQDIHIVETETEQEEIIAIVTLLRKTLMHPTETAALVTADRVLVDKVKTMLKQYGILIHDTSGVALLHTAEVKLFMLLCDSFIPRFSLIHFVALLKNPLLKLTDKESDYLEKIEYFLREKCLNKTRLESILYEFKKCVEDCHNDKTKVSDAYNAYQESYEWLNHIYKKCLAFMTLIKTDCVFSDLVTQHIQTIIAISPGFKHAKNAQILQTIVSSFLEFKYEMPRISIYSYRYLLEHFLKEERVADDNQSINPRILISSFWEMRLIQADRIIIGAMNEGVFPRHSPSDFWLTKDVAQKIGFRTADTRIGQAAHDFSQLCGNKDVWLCRSKRQGGEVTFPSRFFYRMQVFLSNRSFPSSQFPLQKDKALQKVDSGTMTWLYHDKTMAQSLLDFVRGSYCENTQGLLEDKSPKPKPPKTLKPLEFSQSSFTSLLHNPYHFYARHILQLRRLKTLNNGFGTMDFGNIMHVIIANVAKELRSLLSHHSVNIDIIQDCFERMSIKELKKYQSMLSPYEYQSWLKTIHIIGREYADIENRIQQVIDYDYIEINAKTQLVFGEDIISWQARADRIIKKKNAGYTIIDYKTGTIPTKNKFHQMKYPQLLLEAWLLEQKQYTDIAYKETIDHEVDELVYIPLKMNETAYKIYSKGYETLRDNFSDFLSCFAEHYLSEDTRFLYVDDTVYEDYRLLARRL